MSAVAADLVATDVPQLAAREEKHGGLPSTGTIETPTDVVSGLTTAQVESLRTSGQGNVVEEPPGRTYGQIVRENIFTFLNTTLYGIGAVLVVMGLYRDALMSSGFGFLNAAIGVVQESIAKRRLDQVALLARSKATVLRDGQELEVNPEALVLGDVLVLKSGDQAVIDGVVVESSSLAMDESLLTGEADAIPKHNGDPVYAGAFCVSGTGKFQATQVSSKSVASGIVADAKAFRLSLTPLQRSVNSIIRLLLSIAFIMLGMLILQALIWGYDFRDTVIAAAVVMGIVPAGLFVMITLTYSMASLRLSKQNALIQQTNAVESLSNVDVFCMDKTGTLTSNALELRDVAPIQGDDAGSRAVLSVLAHSALSRNKTTEALAAGIPGSAETLLDEVPFSSATKWSALSCNTGATQGVFALGAPEMLGPLLATEPGSPPDGWLDEGLRVLLVASSPDPVSLHDGAGDPVLPKTMQPLCWVAIADQLRPNSQETIQGFQAAGIEIKIISGDNPETVAALAKQAGLTGDVRLVAGTDLAQMSESEFDAAALGGTVFGRITPAQKAELVDALQRAGKYVAMTGDGVNDVMSLKKANLGIAMESGSQATRAVADIVLLQDTFSALPASFVEGQRVRRGLQSVFSLFLTRVFVIVFALLLISVVGIGFPFAPANMTLLTVLTVGFPTFFMAFWAHPGQPPRSLVKSLVAFVLPAAVSIAVAAFAVYTIFYLMDDVTFDELRYGEATLGIMQQGVARDAITYLLVLTGVMLIPLACPPTRWWAVVERTDHDWRPTIVGVVMIVFYVIIVQVGFLRDFFGTHKMSVTQYTVIAFVAVAWLVALRYAYSTHVFERFFGMDLIDDDDYDPQHNQSLRAQKQVEETKAAA